MKTAVKRQQNNRYLTLVYLQAIYALSAYCSAMDGSHKKQKRVCGKRGGANSVSKIAMDGNFAAVTLYGNGEAVAVSRNSGSGTRSGAAYLGKDILGSVRSASNSGGSIDDRYEYDAFGKPYSGNFSTGMNLGYTGKPYDQATGMYNYGYRDYQPVQARFTTVDPIRDGNNWMAYVNNDPVNWVDPWGLESKDVKPTYFKQKEWASTLGEEFALEACAATSLLNEISEEYTTQTGKAMTYQQGLTAMYAAVNSGNILPDKPLVNDRKTAATVVDWAGAANDMWGTTELPGSFTRNDNSTQHKIYALDKNRDKKPDHFVNSVGQDQYYDPSTGKIGNVSDLSSTLVGIRGLDFNP